MFEYEAEAALTPTFDDECNCSDTNNVLCNCRDSNSYLKGFAATDDPSYDAATGNASFFNESTSEVDVDLYYFYANEQFAVLWVLFLLIVLGNSSVLVALFLDKKRKSRMNFFIMQLALADLTVGIFYVLTDIIWRMTVVWHAGNLGCKIIRFLQAVVIYSSTYVLVALSIDRYDAITHPMNFSGSSRRARILVILAWFFSVVFSIPIIVLYEEKSVQEKLQCWIDFKEPWQWQVYLTLISVALFFLPAIIISGCYAIIVFTIWNKGRLLIHSPTYKSSVRQRLYSRTRKDSEEVDSRRASSRGLIPRAKIKTVKMTFVIVFVFILCWSPYFIFDLLQVYGYFPTNQTSIATASFIQSLAPLNSAANPFIYCAFSNHFCRAVRRHPPFRWFTSGTELPDKSFDSGTATESLTTSRRSRTSLRHLNHVRIRVAERKPMDSSVTAV